jgi:shikimate kinase / 3-dehydroquinate synthase
MIKNTRGNIYLTGFSGTGKSSIGKKLAQAVGYQYIDLDEMISTAAGVSIPEIFTLSGEQEFRRMEEEALAQAARRQDAVVATGGGIVCSEANMSLMAATGAVVCLEAVPETILRRLDAQTGANAEERPMLDQAADRMAAIVELKKKRQPFYSMAAWTVHTDYLTPEQVVVEILHGLDALGFARMGIDWPAELNRTDLSVVHVGVESAAYDVLIGEGLLPSTGQAVRLARLQSRRVFVLTDSNLAGLHLNSLIQSLSEQGCSALSYVVSAGEPSKSLECAEGIYDWLIENGAERRSPVIALGGGVVGDLAGFVASTYLRGVPYVQVPTSLLAMVDSSVGGKTAVNSPLAKNSIGSFYQPEIVVADTSLLRTLPERELTSGWGEVIKTAMVAGDGGEFYALLECNQADLRELEASMTGDVVRRCVVVKAAVVGEDERESGRRIILNYGHTIAHGLEAATGYEYFLHGEAVAIGMFGAALIARRLGLVDDSFVERQGRLITGFGLPVKATGVPAALARSAMSHDKKSSGGRIRWVLPVGLGEVKVCQDVPDEVIHEVLELLTS